MSNSNIEYLNELIDKANYAITTGRAVAIVADHIESEEDKDHAND